VSPTPCLKSQGLEEPLVLATQVSLLQRLLHVLLGILSLSNLFEGVVGDDILQSLQLQSVPRRHDVVVVDHLDEWLDLGSFLDSLLPHATGDFRRVALDTGDERIGEWVCLGAGVDWLNDDDLLSSISASSDDGHTADLEDC